MRLISVQYLHGFSAAAGDDLPRLHMQKLVADGTVNVTFLLCPDYGDKTAFQF